MTNWKFSPTAFALLIIINYTSPEAFSSPKDAAAPGFDSSITMDRIRNELSEDGEWIKVTQEEIDAESVTDGSQEFDDNLNTEYVWRPYIADEDWTPYSNGYWKYTNCGWMWVSHYHWGWRPYHYGRWWWSSRWGWVWSPGFIWAPAWVVWMFYDGYCGWYPLSPRVRWHHHYGYRSHHIRYRVRHWRFCHYSGFAGVTINNSGIIPPEGNTELLKYSKFETGIEYSNGGVVNKGPDIKEIEKSAGKEFTAEDVSKYNTTESVREVEKRSYEESNKTYQDKRTGNDEQMKKEDRGYENKETREDKNVDTEKKSDYEKKGNDEKRTDGEKRGKDTYDKKEPNKDGKKNDSYKSESPKEKKKDNDGHNYQDSRDNSRKNDESGNKTSDSKKEGTKSNDGNNSKRNDDSGPRNEGKR